MFSHFSDVELVEAWLNARRVCSKAAQSLSNSEFSADSRKALDQLIDLALKDIAEIEKEASERRLLLKGQELNVENFEFPEASSGTYLAG